MSTWPVPAQQPPDEPHDPGTGRYDVAIVGGGAAGLSAALVLSRARRRVLVLDAGSPRNAPAAHMHGYLSRDGLPPRELLEIGRAEVLRYGGEMERTTVTAATVLDGPAVQLSTSDGRTLHARHVLVTTGLTDRLPDIPGLRERWGRDVLHCPYCHGWEARDQRLAVLADGSPESVRYAHLVRQWSPDVVLLVPPGRLTDQDRREVTARAIAIVEADAMEVAVEDDKLIGISADGELVPRDAVFIPPQLVPNSQLLRSLGCSLSDDGWPSTTEAGQTSIPCVWVAGNVGNPHAQVITAAGEGSSAAIALNRQLIHEDMRLATSAV